MQSLSNKRSEERRVVRAGCDVSERSQKQCKFRVVCSPLFHHQIFELLATIPRLPAALQHKTWPHHCQHARHFQTKATRARACAAKERKKRSSKTTSQGSSVSSVSQTYSPTSRRELWLERMNVACISIEKYITPILATKHSSSCSRLRLQRSSV
jgi:hypothetical protein